MDTIKLSNMFSVTRSFARELYIKKNLIYSLALRELRSGHLGSLLGITWVFVEPLIYISIMWFFFTKAMNFQPSGGYPFVAWLMTAMIIWNYFGAAFSSSVTTIRNYSYLLRRPEFNMSILPVVSILSSLFIHFIFIVILLILFFVSGITFSIFWFQSIYYLFAVSILLLGLAWITSSISLFVKDIKNIVGIILHVGMWVSPIFWDLKTYPEQYRFLLKINPLTYILEGYRKSFLYHEPVWNDLSGSIYFWSVTVVILLVGMVTYKKLRPHFGDVI